MLEHSRLDGQLIAVTGATSGIGYFIAEGLANLGASILVAGRSSKRARVAIETLPFSARHTFAPLDLTDLASIRSAGDLLGADHLDGLVMNAGVIGASRTYESGPFGVESTVGVNFLGHIELLRRAMPALERSDRGRIVSIGSTLTRRVPFVKENWLSELDYRPRRAYAFSKHASEIFGFELARRLEAIASPVRSIVVHPGDAIDALTADRPGVHERSRGVRLAARILARPFSSRVQGKDAAAMPAIAALAAPLPSGTYLGPARGSSGATIVTEPTPTSRDLTLGSWLWDEVQTRLGARIL